MASENNPSNIQNDNVVDTEPYDIFLLGVKRASVAYEITFFKSTKRCLRRYQIATIVV